MSHTAALLETLKKYLKARGVTYKQLAAEMSISEASVKRMFSRQAVSLARLEEICRILDIDFYALAVMDRERTREPVESLTVEQEQMLVKDEKLLIFLYFLINGWTVSLIREKYDYNEIEAIQMLGKLERMGVLEHRLNDNIRLRISRNVFWQINGPLWQRYRSAFVDDFMDNQFGRPDERLVFSPGQLSEASLKIIRKKIDSLIREFNQLAEMDAALPIEGRRSTGLLIGFRPWVFTRIAALRRR